MAWMTLVKNRIRIWGRLQGYALFSSLGKLWRRPLMTLLTFLSIAVILSLPLTFHLVLKNLRGLSGGLGDNWRISLYLKPEVTERQARAVAERLRRHQAVAAVKLIGKEEALAEFRRHSGLGDVLAAMPENPLPAVIEVMPEAHGGSPEELAPLVRQWQRWQEVDFVQWDMRWVQRLRAWLRLVEQGTLLFSALLGLTVFLVVGNTLRLELEDRREEIELMKLLGATDRFVRRPFLYLGFWYGLAGGGLALLLVYGLYRSLVPGVEHLSRLYGGLFRLCFADVGEIGLFWGGSIALAVGSAWLVVTRYLWLVQGRH